MKVYIIKAGIYGDVDTVEVRLTVDGARQALRAHADGPCLSDEADEWDGEEDFVIDNFEDFVVAVEVREAIP